MDVSPLCMIAGSADSKSSRIAGSRTPDYAPTTIILLGVSIKICWRTNVSNILREPCGEMACEKGFTS